MFNDYANHVPWSAYLEAFSEIKLPVVLPKATFNLEPRDDIWPTDVAPIVRRAEGRVESPKCVGAFHRRVRKHRR
jgi:hypothetical protein